MLQQATRTIADEKIATLDRELSTVQAELKPLRQALDKTELEKANAARVKRIAIRSERELKDRNKLNGVDGSTEKNAANYNIHQSRVNFSGALAKFRDAKYPTIE